MVAVRDRRRRCRPLLRRLGEFHDVENEPNSHLAEPAAQVSRRQSGCSIQVIIFRVKPRRPLPRGRRAHRRRRDPASRVPRRHALFRRRRDSRHRHR